MREIEDMTYRRKQATSQKRSDPVMHSVGNRELKCRDCIGELAISKKGPWNIDTCVVFNQGLHCDVVTGKKLRPQNQLNYLYITVVFQVLCLYRGVH